MLLCYTNPLICYIWLLCRRVVFSCMCYVPRLESTSLCIPYSRLHCSTVQMQCFGAKSHLFECTQHCISKLGTGSNATRMHQCHKCKLSDSDRDMRFSMRHSACSLNAPSHSRGYKDACLCYQYSQSAAALEVKSCTNFNQDMMGDFSLFKLNETTPWQSFWSVLSALIFCYVLFEAAQTRRETHKHSKLPLVGTSWYYTPRIILSSRFAWDAVGLLEKGYQKASGPGQNFPQNNTLY